MENETASDTTDPNFSDNRYSFKEGVITKELCDIATQYALLKQQYFDERETIRGEFQIQLLSMVTH